MNKGFFAGLFLLFTLFAFDANAQDDSVKKVPTYKIGIFAPLYLDSVFNKNTFRYKQGIPRFIMPAVDFVQGAEIALDSLQSGNDTIVASFYDTKSYTENVSYLINNKKLDDLNLIIGSVKDVEFTELARFALEKNIPFISATYPNVAGITGNPFLVVLNPTLKSHCDAIYSYILQNHGTSKIYLCRQKGVQEDLIASYFKQINEPDGKPLLNIQTLNFENPLTANLLKAKLDSNSNSVLIGASLNETFAVNMANAAAEIYRSYPITLIGMPTWDGFPALYKKEELSEFPIFYTTAYFNDKTDEFSKTLDAAYQKKYKTKPTDMSFKGFETVYLFTKILAQYPGNFMNHINDKDLKVFCEYNFKPVILKKAQTIPGQVITEPDYFENKHLYLMRILNGSTTRTW